MDGATRAEGYTLRGIDAGRTIAVVIFAVLIILNAWSLTALLRSGSVALADRVVGVLVLVFYALLIFAYLRRARTQTTDGHWLAWLVALLGTGAPFVVPLVADGPRGSGPWAPFGAMVLIGGLSFMLWSVFYLGTNFSIVPQAREVVTSGPYAWVRHPLYAAELVNVAGICLSVRGNWPWAVLVIMALLQYVRARREERLLTRVLVGYDQYRSVTPMLLPVGPFRRSRE